MAYEMFLEVMACNNSKENQQYLEFCLQAAWDTIPKRNSLIRLLKACLGG
jgi:hypothetical protein